MDEKLERAIEIVKARILATSNPDETPHATQALVNITQAQRLYKGLNNASMDNQVEHLLARVRPNLGPSQIMKATQAVLNVMHSLNPVSQTKKKTTT